MVLYRLSWSHNKIWDVATGKLQLTLTGHTGQIRGLATSSRHTYMYSAGDDREVKCWDLTQNKVIRSYPGHLSGVLLLVCTSHSWYFTHWRTWFSMPGLGHSYPNACSCILGAQQHSLLSFRSCNRSTSSHWLARRNHQVLGPERWKSNVNSHTP